MDNTAAQMRTFLAQTISVANYAAEQAAIAQQAVQQIAGLAPLNSPTFTGNPTAPTPALNDNSASVATTAFLARLLGVANGIATLGSDGKLHPEQLPPISVTSVSLVASQAEMLALTGIGIGAIAIRTDIGNAEFILTALPASTLANWTQIGTSPVLSVAGLTGAIASGDLMTALAAAPLASPTFTGTPAAPTPTVGDNTTKIATTAFVAAALTTYAKLASPALTGTPTAPTAAADTNTTQIATTAFVLGQGSQTGDGTPAMDGTAARGTSTHFARADHVHPTDTTRAPLANPAFTGTPSAPTPSPGDNTTKIATTAFVAAAVSAGVAGLAPLASPAFTGTPTAPTQGTGNNSTALATTAFVKSVLPAAPPIPASSIMPVGWSGLIGYATGGTIGNGGTIAGSSLNLPVGTAAGFTLSGGAQTGTWMNISGGASQGGDIRLWVRIS